MTWSFVAAGAVGMLMGTRFRVPALLGMSFVAVIASVASMQLSGFSGQRTFLMTLLLMLTLQGAYLIGLLLKIVLHRYAIHRRRR